MHLSMQVKKACSVCVKWSKEHHVDKSIKVECAPLTQAVFRHVNIVLLRYLPMAVTHRPIRYPQGFKFKVGIIFYEAPKYTKCFLSVVSSMI